MQLDNIAQINRISDDLDCLIAEIENNPRISIWVVRMALKSIKDNARKKAIQAAQVSAYVEKQALLN